MSLFSRSWLLVAFVVLSGCGFQPVYSTTDNIDVRGEFAVIDIAPIKDRVGQQLRNELIAQINREGRPRAPKYRLAVEITVSETSLAIKKTEVATRASQTFSATYRLVPIGSGGVEIYSGTSRIVTSFNVLTNDYATLAAEADAARRGVKAIAADISNRLAAHFKISNPR